MTSSIGGWKHPASYEWMMLANLFDLTFRANSKKSTTIDRPWENVSSRIAPSRIRTRDEIDSILDKMNPARRGGDG